MWTHFSDLHSGGRAKEWADHIYVELPYEQAVAWFKNVFGHDPENTTWTWDKSCVDYNITCYESFIQLSAYERGCAFDQEDGKYIEAPARMDGFRNHYRTVQDYVRSPNVLVFGTNIFE